MDSSPDEDLPWDQLSADAERVIEETINSLPEPIREEARKIPCLLQEWPPDDEDGPTDDLLGLYPTFELNTLSAAPGPIFIFLGPLYHHCTEHTLDFAEEVRVTYLHELGHHLGMDEDDLDERGLG